MWRLDMLWYAVLIQQTHYMEGHDSSTISQKFARSLHGIKRKMPSGRHGRPALVHGRQIQSRGGCKSQRLLAFKPTIGQPASNIFRHETCMSSHDGGQKSRRCLQRLKHQDSVKWGSLAKHTRRQRENVKEKISLSQWRYHCHSTSTLVGQKHSAWKGELLDRSTSQ